ncbi:C3HC zinc finger protein [Purpureocillium lavendulum]|uniref:C3HC zinc finger protein n=1 Tax=Purpureocillium lavendulum TaxID=1247861 RepID=A0AB34FKV1_9HYPO|nr:C3HC zinc finger protein [Purpureocillium lavendulum]
MHATKRKFNALLQGLSNPRPTSTTDAPSGSMSADARRGDAAGASSHDALLQKRRRLGFPDSTAPAAYNPSLPSSISSALRRSTTQASAKSTKDKDTLAKYAPGDRDELLKRLATFQELTDWTPKPERVNEVEWAKRGWICRGKERVRCVLCHKELVVKLNRKDVDGKEVPVLVPSEIEDALVEKYTELIVSSHQQDCLWRRRGCDDSLLRLSFSNTQSILSALRCRYDELCSRSSFLPYEFNLRLPEDLKVDDVLAELPADFFADSKSAEEPAKPVNRPALALALMGWQGLSNARIGAVPNSASCHTCLRRLGLWMFKSKEVDDDGQVLVPAPMDFLDPVREHRFFCPWSSAKAQSRGTASAGSSDQPGWAILLQTIKNDSELRDVYEGRSKRFGRLIQEHEAPPSTPGRVTDVQAPATPGQPATPGAQDQQDEEVDEKAREAKDKERWARLRKVKSLFETKGARRLRRPLSRPGTANSNKSGV